MYSKGAFVEACKPNDPPSVQLVHKRETSTPTGYNPKRGQRPRPLYTHAKVADHRESDTKQPQPQLVLIAVVVGIVASEYSHITERSLSARSLHSSPQPQPTTTNPAPINHNREQPTVGGDEFSVGFDSPSTEPHLKVLRDDKPQRE